MKCPECGGIGVVMTEHTHGPEGEVKVYDPCPVCQWSPGWHGKAIKTLEEAEEIISGLKHVG